MMLEDSEFNLNEDEAASKLGITKELLFAYARHAPKAHMGHARKLEIIRHGQQYRFSARSLEEWDAYLREPWSTSGKTRPHLPAYIDEYLKVESGGRCAKCGKGYKLENAHIEDYSISLSHHHHNLIRICKDCHSGDTDRLIDKEELKTLKAFLIQKIRLSILEEKPILNRRGVHHPPPASQFFVGRSAELDLLSSNLPTQRLIVVEGIGGIGKTEFLKKALMTASDRSTLWFDVESYHNCADLLLGLGPALLDAGIQLRADKSLFVSLDRTSIRIVMDGLDRVRLNELDQVIDFVRNLVEFTNGPQVIITTQVELTDLSDLMFRITLPPLTRNESLELVIQGCSQLQDRIQLPGDSVDWLIGFCDGHALALRIVIGLVAFYKNGTAVMDLLRSFGTRELKSPTRFRQVRASSLRTTLEAAFSCFNDNEKKLIQYISNFPAGCSEPFIRHHTQDVFSEHSIATLRRFFFIELSSDWWNNDRFEMLNPVREFVRDVWQIENADEAARIDIDAVTEMMMQLVVRAVNFIDSDDEALVAEGLTRIDYDLPNYLHGLSSVEHQLRHAVSNPENRERYLRLLEGLGKGLSRYIFIRGFFEQGISITQRTIDVLLEQKDYDSAATQYEFLASYQNRLHDILGLEETAQALSRLATHITEPEIDARASTTLGEHAEATEKYSEAISHYTAAVHYYQSTLDADQKGHKHGIDVRAYEARIGMLHNAIGTCYNYLRKPQTALTHLLSAREYTCKAGDHPNLGGVNHQLGNTYSELNQYDKAMEAYWEAVNSFVRLGYKEYLSNAVGEMGYIISDQNFDSKLDARYTHEILQLALSDIQYSVSLLFSVKAPGIAVFMSVLRKLFGVIRVLGFTSKTDILGRWVNKFGDDFFRSLVNEKPSDDKKAFIYYLTLILHLAEGVAEICSDRKECTNERIADLCCICEDFDDYGWRAFGPYDWLAAVLRYRSIYPVVTGRELRGALLDAHDSGGHAKFTLAVESD